MIRLKAALARMVGRLSRALGRGGGTTLPGRLLIRMDRNAIDKLGAGLCRGSTLISATNGKTTTSSMLRTILAAEGRHPVSNTAGSNMTWGVATALLEQRGEEGVFEVDEAWLPETAERLDPKVILLCNLFRDQLDRHGETETLADSWRELAAARAERTRFVLNADDPLIADIGQAPAGSAVSWFGIEDPGVALPDAEHAHDARLCRNCGEALTYEWTYLGHLGRYHCGNCGLLRPEPAITAREIRLRGMDGVSARIDTPDGSYGLDLPLPGVYNLYNALAAIATARELGVPPSVAVDALAGMKAVFGRVERIQVESTDLSILLIKNPAGANEVLRTLALEPDPIHLWIALNDRVADGRDVSWVWDANFEDLSDRVERVWCTGTRAPEMAVRLKYASWPEDRIELSTDPVASFDRALEATPNRLFALPTYTALLSLRRLLTERGEAPNYWE
ncbi:MAG: MurT ligase domain-containing protein [Solirubrobacterales bacterium]|nr:MurT ligase domain-containing protein [Solirubrobacterales bacterium]